VGGFETIGDQVVNHIAAWDGREWRAFGNGWGFDRPLNKVLNDPSSGDLFVTGSFIFAGDVRADRIARWNGLEWEALGEGISGAGASMVMFDDGSGSALYVAGSFLSAGGQPVARIARWDGQAWQDVGGGMDRRVDALCVYDDGTGVALYAGGTFSTAGGQTARGIAKWDGLVWSEVGGGIPQFSSQNIGPRAMVVHDDGSGPCLYVGGNFSMAGDVPVSRVARWDGALWTAVGSGLSLTGPTGLWSVDLGQGPILLANSSINGEPNSGLVRWDGLSWSVFNPPVGGGVSTVAVFEDGGGRAMYVGGWFHTAGKYDSSYAARWGCELPHCPADLNADGLLNFFDFSVFISNYNAQTANADFNGDGQFNFFDFTAFVDAFNSGCP
jgi:hypothetical protein